LFDQQKGTAVGFPLKTLLPTLRGNLSCGAIANATNQAACLARTYLFCAAYFLPTKKPLRHDEAAFFYYRTSGQTGRHSSLRAMF
jgi:hypothetical protein